MKTLIRFSVEHPVSILSVVLALILFGLLSCFIIPVDFLPRLSERNLLVTTRFEGISAGEMRSLVTIPLEEAFSSMKGLKTSSSVSRDGLCILNLEMHWGTDIDLAVMEAREIIDTAYERLPASSEKPQLLKKDPGRGSTISLACIPLDRDLRYARYLCDTDIKARFQRLSGVGQVQIVGGEKDEIHILVQKDKLDARNLSLDQVANIIAESNFEFPAGMIREGENDYMVRTSALYKSIAEITSTPLLYRQGLLRLGDIARLEKSAGTKDSFFLHDGKECIKIEIRGKNDASPLAVSRNVRNELAKITEMYGHYYEFKIVEDQSREIMDSINALLISAIAGMAVTVIIIRVFLRTWKLSLIVASLIPVSALASVCTLAMCGRSLNIMSLSGIAIGIGMVVDAATVVMENIQAMANEGSETSSSTLIINACSGVAASNLGSALTTTIVFIPLFFIEGILGELFSDLAISVISAIMTSCLLSFTYIPSLIKLMQSGIQLAAPDLAWIFHIRKGYSVFLGNISDKAGLLLISLAGCAALGFVSVSLLEFELLPSLYSESLEAEIQFPPGTSITSMQKTAQEINAILREEPGITSVQMYGGIDRDDYTRLADIDEHAETLRIHLRFRGGSKHYQPQVESLLKGNGCAAAWENSRDSLAKVLANTFPGRIIRAETPEALWLLAERYQVPAEKLRPSLLVTESVFTPDRLAAARFSISAQAMAQTARASLYGVYTSPYYEKGRKIPMLVKLQEGDINSLEDLGRIGVQADETVIPLRFLGNISEKEEEKILFRYNRMDAKYLEASGDQTAIPDIINPADDEMRGMLRTGILLIIVCIGLLYLVMGAQFESFLIPLMLLIALPPSFSGAFLFLLISGKTLNINSIMALVILFGISVNNSILLYEQCVAVKKINRDSIIQSSAGKIRAILITNATTIAALIPFSIDPLNRNPQSSLAVAVIGGILFSAAIVLTVVPCVFMKLLPGRSHEK